MKTNFLAAATESLAADSQNELSFWIVVTTIFWLGSRELRSFPSSEEDFVPTTAPFWKRSYSRIV